MKIEATFAKKTNFYLPTMTDKVKFIINVVLDKQLSNYSEEYFSGIVELNNNGYDLGMFEHMLFHLSYFTGHCHKNLIAIIMISKVKIQN